MNSEQYQYTDGRVFLVGAGPGDPELITVKGSGILREADVIVYDRLVNPELLSVTPASSEHIYVGKRPGKPSVSQQQINRMLISKAREGKTVVRLKGGDPFVFGRGGEECEALRKAKIPFEVVPGISSALAAPAFAGIPVTHRKTARSFTVVTGHTIDESDYFENWQNIAHADTLVILMGMGNLARITEVLIGYGRDRETPAAVIQNATYRSQKTVTGTLADIAGRAENFSGPATVVVGELAALGTELSWFETGEMEVEITSENRLFTNFAG